MNYTPIQSNVYPQELIPQSYSNDQEGHCYCHRTRDLPNYCTSDCINKNSKIQCDDSNCLCINYCTNRNFTKGAHNMLEVVESPGKGSGLITLTPIYKEDFVIQYIGEVYDIDTQYGQKRFKQNKQNKTLYMMQLSQGVMVDAYKQGNLSRFINHSCEPNCKVEKWIVKGRIRLGIFALRNIYKYEELSYNYRQCFWASSDFSCCCGTGSCAFKSKTLDSTQISIKVKIGHLMYLREKYEYYVKGTPSTITWNNNLLNSNILNLGMQIDVTISGSFQRVLADKNMFKRLSKVECIHHLVFERDISNVEKYLSKMNIFFIRTGVSELTSAIYLSILGLSSELKQIKNFLSSFLIQNSGLHFDYQKRPIVPDIKTQEESQTAILSSISQEQNSPFPQKTS